MRLPADLPSWWPIVALAVGLVLAQRFRIVRALTSLVLTVGLIVLAVALLGERARFDPFLARIAARLHLDDQQVVGHEVRIRLAPDGHFWARARIDGVERRMLIDSGATVTALTATTARAAGLHPETGILPVRLTTANGTIDAATTTIGTLRLGDITARSLPVVVSPAFGDMNVLGMNFLSRLASWRVEGSTLILVPHHPQRSE